ncbi:integrase [Chromobacterium haemolyticum]|uniref:integrase n=1 Tax=Chromobacterium TaxID=535 RepID=UPI004055F9EF
MSINDKLVTFVPKKEKDAENNLQQFIEFGRNKLTTYGAGLVFDNNEWDISDYIILKGMANNRIRLRFYTYRSLTLSQPEAFLEPYNSFSKAYIRYINAFQQLKSFSIIMGAIRILYEALGEINEVSPTKIDTRVLNRAAQLTIENYSPGTAKNIAGQVEKIAKFLGEHQLTLLPVYDWKNPVRHRQNSTRVGQEFDEKRAKKMPSTAALDSLPKAFRLAEETPFVLVSSIAAILCSAPDRINEILLLPIFCEAHQRAADGPEAYGLRWWPAKGAEPMVKWIVPSMVEVVAEALKKIRRCTERAREVARWYENNPHKVYLLPEYEHLRAKPLLTNREVGFILFGKETNRSVINEWYKKKGIKTVVIKGKHYAQFDDIERFVVSQLPRGFPWLNAELGLKFSDALCVSLKNDLATDKASWVGIIQGISVNQVNNRLGPKPGSHHITIFERYGFTEPDGSPIKVTTHQFRHYLNTLAQAGGLSQLDIAKWSGRKDIRQNATYDHVSADELVLKIRNALGDDRQMYGPLAKLPPRTVIRRDEFARLKVPTAHTTEFGVCIHDYTMAPCQLHADCLNCNEQVCIKGDEVRTARLRAELETAKENLETAQQAHGNGFFGASRWAEHHQLTIERLSQLCAILDDPQVPVGAVIQLSNLPTASRIEHAVETRAAVEHKQVAPSPSTTSMDAMRNLLAGMGNVNG